jgi:hypothetical protein
VNSFTVASRSLRFDLDYAGWHAHLAARQAPSRLFRFEERRSIGARSVRTGPLIHLDLVAWRARLGGATRTAA